MAAARLMAEETIQVRDGYLAQGLAGRAYAALAAFVIPSAHLYVQAGSEAALAQFLPPFLADFITVHLSRLTALAPPRVRARLHGFEIWSTRAGRRADGRIYLHLDCDEALRRAGGVLRLPLLGSVLYLGPGAGLVGGQTAFLTGPSAFAPFQFHDWALLAPHARSVAPHPGRLALFAGDLAHGQAPVLAHPPGCPRVALLVNLWDGRIGDVGAGICRLDRAAFQAKARRA